MRVSLLLSSLFLLLSANLTLAQQRGGGPNSQRPNAQVKAQIKGQVVDGQNGQALEYGTLTLYSMRDSAMITGGVSDLDGRFVIEARPGRFYAKVEFISYASTVIGDIILKPGQMTLDLGIIKLYPDAAVLAEVEVRAEKSEMQMTLDKKVFNVGKDLANIGGTASDILDNVPSVQVDVEGNVSLRGSGNVRILVNGRPSGLVGVGDTDGLRQIPSNLIDKIEVITNPSARYEAEGMTGIINIVLRKERKVGINGSFDFTVGYPDNYATAINLNYRRDKVNLFANYGLRYRRNPGSGALNQRSIRNDTTFALTEDRDHLRGGWSNSFRFGSDFFINPKNTITASLSYRVSDEDNETTIRYRDFIFDEFVAESLRTDNESEDESDLEYAITYKKTFKRDGHKWTADVQFEQNEEIEGSELVTEFFDLQPNLNQRSSNTEGLSRWLFQTDFVYPFSKESQFEAGGRISLRNIENEYLVEEFDDVEWQVLPNFSNDFNYIENIYALYLSYGNKHNKFSYQVGLRGEHSDVITELLNTNEINDRSYTNLFPTAHMNYEFPKDNALQLSYSRRITRPRFRSLNPFFTFSNNRNIFTGNPDLDPEFTHSFELQHIKYWGKTSISSSIYYRHTEGVVERIIETLDEEQGITQRFPINLSTEDAYGVEFTFSYSPYKWLRLNGDFNFFHAIRDGQYNEQRFYNDTYTWFSRLTSRVKILKKTDVQLRVNYRAPRETTQGRNKAIYYLTLAMSRDVFKNKGTLTLSISDLFNSRRWRSVYDIENLYGETEFQWRARTINLTLNYRLNQKKQRRRGGGRRGGGDYGGGEF
ncbi:MAG: TonB-dependent receptor [Bacteroidota bacterium]